MEELWSQFQQIQKRIVLREKAAYEARELLQDELQDQLRSGLIYYNGRFFALRVFPVTLVGLLIMTPVLQKKTPYYLKELSLVFGLSAGILYGDYLNSNYFWDHYGQLITENTNYNDMGMSVDQMEKMKQLYLRSKQYKPEAKNNEKIYDN